MFVHAVEAPCGNVLYVLVALGVPVRLEHVCRSGTGASQKQHRCPLSPPACKLQRNVRFEATAIKQGARCVRLLSSGVLRAAITQAVRWARPSRTRRTLGLALLLGGLACACVSVRACVCVRAYACMHACVSKRAHTAIQLCCARLSAGADVASKGGGALVLAWGLEHSSILVVLDLVGSLQPQVQVPRSAFDVLQMYV